MSEPPPIVAWAPPTTASAIPGSAFRSARTLARVAAVLIGISVALHAIDGVLSVYGIGLLSDIDNVTDQQLEDFDFTVGLVALGTVALIFLAGIVFLTWIRRVVINVRELGDGESLHTPNWSVIWWFVPIASFFKPYQIVSDAWTRLAASPAEASTRLVGLWWLLFAGSNALGVIYGRLPAPTTIESFTSLETFNAIIDLLVVIAGILVIKVIFEIERRSNARALAIATGAVPLPQVNVLSAPTRFDETLPKWSPD